MCGGRGASTDTSEMRIFSTLAHALLDKKKEYRNIEELNVIDE
jgi:hypothetical protein